MLTVADARRSSPEGTTMRPRVFAVFGMLLAVSYVLAADPDKAPLGDELITAAKRGDVAAVTALLDKGADVNAKTPYGVTALIAAADKGHAEVIKVLLARKADAKAKDTFYNFTALSWAV